MDDLAHDDESLFEEQLDLLRQFYVLQNDDDVLRFLKQYPLLVPLLLEASQHLAIQFPAARVVLHVSHPSEGGVGDEEELVAFISTYLPPRQAVEALKQFYSSWWSQAVHMAQGKMAFGLECLIGTPLL